MLVRQKCSQSKLSTWVLSCCFYWYDFRFHAVVVGLNYATLKWLFQVETSCLDRVSETFNLCFTTLCCIAPEMMPISCCGNVIQSICPYTMWQHTVLDHMHSIYFLRKGHPVYNWNQYLAASRYTWLHQPHMKNDSCLSRELTWSHHAASTTTSGMRRCYGMLRSWFPAKDRSSNIHHPHDLEPFDNWHRAWVWLSPHSISVCGAPLEMAL